MAFWDFGPLDPWIMVTGVLHGIKVEIFGDLSLFFFSVGVLGIPWHWSQLVILETWEFHILQKITIEVPWRHRNSTLKEHLCGPSLVTLMAEVNTTSVSQPVNKVKQVKELVVAALEPFFQQLVIQLVPEGLKYTGFNLLHWSKYVRWFWMGSISPIILSRKLAHHMPISSNGRQLMPLFVHGFLAAWNQNTLISTFCLALLRKYGTRCIRAACNKAMIGGSMISPSKLPCSSNVIGRSNNMSLYSKHSSKNLITSGVRL